MSSQLPVEHDVEHDATVTVADRIGWVEYFNVRKYTWRLQKKVPRMAA